MRYRRFTLPPILALLLWLVVVGCGPAEPPPTPTPVLTADERAGYAVYTQRCAPCHSIADDTIIVGPTLAGIATTAGQRVSGQDARTYLYTAILDPGAYVVEGFNDLMPATLGKTLTGEELDAVVAYMLTLE